MAATSLTRSLVFVSFTLFLDEFSSLLEKLVITGDFNFHLDNPSDPAAAPFLVLLDVF